MPKNKRPSRKRSSSTYIGKRAPSDIRFWKSVNKTNTCWFWTGYQRKGYGSIKVKYIHTYAHRFSWELHHGSVPEGKMVLHSCDTPLCVNPDHLFLGTVLDNSADCVSKERHPRGETHGQAKLTEQQVREIKQQCIPGSRLHGFRPLARKYKVSKPVIAGIVKNQGWKHV